MPDKFKFLLTLFILDTIFVFAQDDATNTGTVYISTGTIVAQEGSFTITPSGSTDNGGDFYLKGDWVNNGTYITNTGKVTYWGSRAQNISGTTGTSFYNAVVNKPSNGVTVNIDAEIENILTLTNGPVDLNSHKISINNSAGTGIGYTNGYLISEKTDNSSILQWKIGSTIGAHVIPFGKTSGTIIPLTLNLTAGDLGNVTTSTYPSAPDNTPYPVTPVLVANMNDVYGNDNSANVVDRFWQIDKEDGTSGTVTITFTYANGEEPANGEGGLVSQRYFSGWEVPVPFQTANAALNTATTPGVTVFGPYTLSQSANPLPVELLVFNALPNQQKQVDINWVTASEKNSDYFLVERSKDGIHFATIEKIKAAGNSNSTLYYKTLDKSPFDGVSYYRLKQTDFNGSYFFSEIKVVNFNEANNTPVSIFPNPATSSAAIYFNNTDDLSDKIKVQIYDAVGKLVVLQEFAQLKTNMLILERNNLTQGVYFIKILNNKQLLYSGKIIFQ